MAAEKASSRAGTARYLPSPAPARPQVQVVPADETMKTDLVFGLHELSVAVQALRARNRGAVESGQFLGHLDGLRKEKGLTFDRLGRMCRQHPELGMNRSSIYKMLTSGQWPTHKQLAAFLWLCDLSPHEYSIWLTEYARGRAPSDPDYMLESVLQPQREPRRGSTELAQPRDIREPRQPQPLTRPRPHTRRRWFQRSLTHVAGAVFGAATTTATAGVITLHLLGIPSQLIGMACIAAAAGVVTWTYALLNPSTEHQRRYPTGEDPFTTDAKAAPPVIGL